MERRRTHPLARIGRRAAELAAGLPAGSTDYVVTRDLRVPMSDGVELLGDLYRPRGAAPDAVVLIRTPYGRTTLGSRVGAIVLARRGFQVFLQSVRGGFGSGGTFRPFTTEHRDGLDTLAWVRAQRWCDGRVATTGASYFGHTQWAVAPYAAPPLVSSSLHITAARITDGFFEHGAPGLLSALSWSDLLARQERRAPLPLLAGVGRRARVLRALRARPLREADVAVAGTVGTFWRDFTEHAEPDDPFWHVADHDGADLSRMPPVNMVTGWWDLFLQAQLHDWGRLQAAGVPGRLTVGPWLHGALPEARTTVETDLAWLEHHLRDGPEPTGAPVRVWLQHGDRWLDLERWPPPGTVSDVRFLTHDGGLAPTPPAAGGSASTFTFDPSDPTPVAGGPLLTPPGGQVDDRAMEAGTDVVVFTAAPETDDLDIVGEVRARIHVQPQLEHADVFVRLCDVDPDGVSRNVVEGIRRLDPRTVPAHDVAVGEDGVLAVDVELFPTAYRVRAGHRLRVVISGGAFPRFAPNPGLRASLADAPPGRPCRFRIFHDADHPSRMELQVLPPAPEGVAHESSGTQVGGGTIHP